MSKMGIFKIFVVFALFVSLGNASEKRYEIKSGMVEYNITGGGGMLGFETKIEGKSRLIFKDWGNLELNEEETSTSVMGGVEKSHTLTKIDGDTVYSVDFDRKTIYKSKMSDYFGKNRDIGKISGKDMLKKMGGKKIGKDKVLGYECEVWEFLGSKICMYKGVVLKSEGNIMGMKHKSEAVKAEFNIKIDDEKFKLPDYPIKDIKEIPIENSENEFDEKELKQKSKEFEDFMENFKGLMSK